MNVIDSLIELIHDKGIQIGFSMGLLHEFYRLEVLGRKIKWWSFLSHVGASVIMGWLSCKIGTAADLGEVELYCWISFTSLNVFLVVAVFTDRQLIGNLVRRYLEKK